MLGGNYLLKFNRKLQNILLFLGSIGFYAWGEPKFCIVLLCSIVVNWLIAYLIEMVDKHSIKKASLVVAIILNIGLLFVYKYLNFAVKQFNGAFGTSFLVREIILPIGISFFTFQALSYVVDVYRGLSAQKSILNVGLYIAFFPQLIAGPIVRYNSIAEQIDNRKETFDKFKMGVCRFMEGFSKKVLLANTMAQIADKAFNMPVDDRTMSFAWLGAIAYTLQIFFDFSGYSDMAIGLGKMFGFEFEENFNYPYTAISVTDFWRRWHISLSTWFRDYLYIPLGGSRSKTKTRNYINLFIVWVFTGIWHGANWTFIVWGLFYFVFLFVEKAFNLSELFEKHHIVGHFYTLLVVIFAWVIFRADSLPLAVQYVSSMFDFANIYSGITWVYIKEYLVYFVFAIALSTKLLGKAKDTRALHLVFDVLLTCAFFVSVLYVINGTYNPFIYFNF